MKIKLNDKTLLDLVRLIASKLFVYANSGFGKSWLLRRLIEQCFSKIQIIIIDPEGEFSTLREKYDFVLVGKGPGYDVQADPRTAALLAQRVLQEKISVIIDLYELDPGDGRNPDTNHRDKFVAAFSKALVNASKDLWHPYLYIVDEAQDFAPEKGNTLSSAPLHALAKKGRKRGCCIIPATQRMSDISKALIAACNNKLIGQASLDIDMKRAAAELGFTTREEMLSLRNLEPGEFYAFGPALSKEVRKIKIGGVETSHPDSSKIGAKIGMKVTPASDKVKKALAKLADLPKEVEEETNTMAYLKKENAKMKSLLNEKPKLDQSSLPMGVSQWAEYGKKYGYWDFFEAKTRKEFLAFKNFVFNRVTEITKKVQDLGHEARKETTEIVIKQLFTPPKKEEVGKFHIHKIAELQPDGSEKVIFDEDTTIGKGERAVLIAAVQYRNLGIDRAGVTTVTGYQRSSRDAYIARLLKRGYVMFNGDKLYPTQDGADYLGDDYQPMPTGQELRDHLMTTLPQGERIVLSALIGQRMDGEEGFISREWITQETNYQRSSRDAYIARLANRQLVEVTSGGVRAVNRLFEDL